MNLIYSFDIRVADFFFSLREPWLVGFFSAITILGEWQVIILFVFITLLVLWFLKKRVYIIPLLLSVVGSEAMTYLIKAILRRPRPELAFYLEDSFSFPSGHATIAVAFYGFLLFMFLRFVKTQKSKIFFFFAGLFIILMIGFSRLYLGVHYFSDVLGGYLVGFLWLAIAISAFNYFNAKSSFNIN